jgi:hypothetical protein
MALLITVRVVITRKTLLLFGQGCRTDLLTKTACRLLHTTRVAVLLIRLVRVCRALAALTLRLVAVFANKLPLSAQRLLITRTVTVCITGLEMIRITIDAFTFLSRTIFCHLFSGCTRWLRVALLDPVVLLLLVRVAWARTALLLLFDARCANQLTRIARRLSFA